MAPYEETHQVSRTTTTAIIIALCLVTVNAAPPTDADCTSDAPFADTDNCTCYYQCFNVGSSWMLVHLDCPSGGIWDDVNKACVAGTCEEPTTTTTPDPTTSDDLDSTSSADTGSSTVSDSASTSASSSASSSSASSEATSGSAEASSVPSTTASQSEESTTMLVSTSGPPTFVCTSTGFFAHPTDPSKYYQCVLIGAQFYYYIYSCPPSACFQQSAGVCVVGACESSNTTTVAPPATTAVTSPPVDIICDSQGQYPFPGSCTKYYNCILLDDGFVYYVFECPPGSYFNSATSLCTTGQCPSTSVTTAATTTTTAVTTTTTTTPAPDHPCPTEGYFVDPADCQSYYRCIIINGQMYRYMFRCPAGSYWNSNLQGCIVGACPTTTGMTTPSQASTTAVVASPSPPQPFSCSQVGVFPDSSNCSIYHRCLNINGQLYLYNYSCPPNTRFDPSTQLCVVGSC